MSTAYSSAKQQYIGNGVTTEWGFDFPIQKHSELKVYLKRSASPQVLLEEGVDYSFVTENTIAFPIKTGEAKLQATDVLALQRESVFESEYNFSNQQRLEPEEVMHADDNLERQIQELKRDVTQAIRIQPTSNINTDEYFVAVESIYENLDNITNVSGISAEIVNCSDNISDISAVSSNIANVNAVGQSISNVNTVASDISSVNTVAGVSTDVTAVANVADSVHTVANNSSNVTTVATNISDINTAATNIEAIKDAPNQASNAAQSATNSANSATDSANSATASATSAQAAQDALNDVQGLIATPIGTIFQSVYVDESLDIARQLNGQLISSTKFTGFRSWLNTVQTAAPNLFTTETNWQAEKTNSKLGQCGKFVIDDTAGTIRLPCVVNAQGLVDLALIGGIKNESLPNIVSGSNTRIAASSAPFPAPTGASAIGTNTTQMYIVPTDQNTSATYDSLTVNALNASISSSTYQDNAPVQQEAVQYPYYIQVATGVEETLPAIREYNINTPFFFGQSMYSDVAPDNASWLASNGQYNAKTVYPDYYDWLVDKMNAGVSGFVASTAAYTDYDFVINTADQTFRLPLLNGDRVLVKKYVSGEDWYNLYSDGWIEQGGAVQASYTGQTITLNMLKSFSNTNWTIVTTVSSDVTPPCLEVVVGQGKTNNSIGVIIAAYSENNKTNGFYWKACGYAPVPTQSEFTEVTGLYYYVGDTVQDASLINAGAVLGQLSIIAAQNSNPTGTIIIWSTSTPPAGYLVCNGAAISRTTYARLFSVIGTTWGAGDGNTTFNLPNFNGAKIIRGNNIAVYGTGRGLRLTNSASGVGGYMFQHVFDSGAGEFDTSIYVTNYASNANVGAAQSGGLLPNNVVLGVPPKAAGNFDSGLQADLSDSQNVVYCIRY